MVKLLHAYFPTRTLLLAVSEVLLVGFSLTVTTILLGGSDSDLKLLYDNGLLKIVMVAFVCLLCMYYFDLYDSIVATTSREVLVRLIQAWGTTCIVLAVLYYAYPQTQLGGRSFAAGALLASAALVVGRKVFTVVSRSPRLADRAIIFGEGSLATALAKEIEGRPELGVRLVGYAGCSTHPALALNGLAYLGGVENLPEIIRRERVRRIIVSLAERRGRLPVQELLHIKANGVLVEDGATFYEIVTGKVPLEAVRLSWLLFSPGFRVSKALLIYKRVLSVALAFLGLVISLPVLGIIAAAIWLESGSPILFRQERVGKDGRLFALYKFRSMRRTVEPNGKLRPAQDNDERFTRVGRWLRRTRLDELPQLYNILRGDMYFVGPRPFAREEEEELSRQIPFYSQRWIVKPGATGWAQVQRGYCASLQDNEEKLSYDLFYIKNMSVGLDLLILFQTVKVLLIGRGAR